MDDFYPKVPLMVALKNSGMRERHWEQISEKVGYEVYPREGFTFKTVLKLDLMTYVDFCIEVGDKAAKEFTIE